MINATNICYLGTIDLLGEREIIHAEDIERVKAWDRALNQAKDTIYELSLTVGSDKFFEMEYGSEALERVKFERELRELGVQGGRDSAGVLYGPLADYMERYDAGVKWEKERKAQKEYEKQHTRELEHKEKQEEDEAREFFRRRDEFKNRLRSPEQIAREELRDLRDNRSNLTDTEYGRGRREIGEKLMGAMGGGEIQPVGMLEAGSAELHSLLAKANLPDPKIALAQRMLVELEKIVAKMDAEDQL